MREGVVREEQVRGEMMMGEEKRRKGVSVIRAASTSACVEGWNDDEKRIE